MDERNKVTFQSYQNNILYTISTSLIGNRINLVCSDGNSKVFENNYTVEELTRISQYFKPSYTIEQVQLYLNGIMEMQKIDISSGDEAVTLNLHLINNDLISIPLLKKTENIGFTTTNYNNYFYAGYNTLSQPNYLNPNTNKTTNTNLNLRQNSNTISNPAIPEKVNIAKINPNILPHSIEISNNQKSKTNNRPIIRMDYPNYIATVQTEKNANIIPKTENIIPQKKNSNVNMNLNLPPQTNRVINIIPPAKNMNINVNTLPQSQSQRYYSKNSGSVQINTANQSQTQNQLMQNNQAYKSVSLDENKLKNLENENNMIKVGQEQLKNDIKRLMQEMTKLKEENEVYKTNHNSLTNENAVLKTQSDNIKKQMMVFQNQNKALIEENNMLKKQNEGLNKDLDNVESQNDEIRKMYEELQNEYNQYRAQTEEINKENELLREQIEELNNNFTMINSELDNIRKENDIFKNNLEQQKKELNEDMVNKLIEENNELKSKLEENEYLKKQIEEMKFQMQQSKEIEKERETNEEPEHQGEEEEEKGEIIHDMKELELITNKINKGNQKIIINLLYKASVDGDKASIFHEKCDQAKSTIVLVETLNGKRFGGFTTCSWAGNCEDKNDPQAFIFSLDKMQTYDNIPGDEAIGCYPKFGPIFLGCQIKIFDNAFTKGGTTFEKELNFNTKEDYELTGGDRVFNIKEIEVYEVVME